MSEVEHRPLDRGAGPLLRGWRLGEREGERGKRASINPHTLPLAARLAVLSTMSPSAMDIPAATGALPVAPNPLAALLATTMFLRPGPQPTPRLVCRSVLLSRGHQFVVCSPVLVRSLRRRHPPSCAQQISAPRCPPTNPAQPNGPKGQRNDRPQGQRHRRHHLRRRLNRLHHRQTAGCRLPRWRNVCSPRAGSPRWRSRLVENHLRR